MRVYETYVEVSGVELRRGAAVSEVLGLSVPSEDGVLPVGTNGLLVEGEVALDDEDDEATAGWRQRTAVSIFAANKGPCRVHFEMTEKRVEPEVEETFDKTIFAELRSGASCKFCKRDMLIGEPCHRHDGKVVCDECFDERLRMTE